MGPKEIQHALAQLICLNGMTTNADLPGVEKVVCTCMRSDWLMEPALDLDGVVLSEAVKPQSIFMVKGWNRGVCCLAVLWACFENTMLEAEKAVDIMNFQISPNQMPIVCLQFPPAEALPSEVRKHLVLQERSKAIGMGCCFM